MHNMNCIYTIIITQLKQKFFNCQSNMISVKSFNFYKMLFNLLTYFEKYIYCNVSMEILGPSCHNKHIQFQM